MTKRYFDRRLKIMGIISKSSRVTRFLHYKYNHITFLIHIRIEIDFSILFTIWQTSCRFWRRMDSVLGKLLPQAFKMTILELLRNPLLIKRTRYLQLLFFKLLNSQFDWLKDHCSFVQGGFALSDFIFFGFKTLHVASKWQIHFGIT